MIFYIITVRKNQAEFGEHMEKLYFSGREVVLFPSGESDDTVYLIGEGESAEEIFSALPSPKPNIAAVESQDWNAELSPWRAAAVFRKGGDFSGSAGVFLHELCGFIVPEAEKLLGCGRRMIAGYSLAGLFSVWATYNTDLFSCAASMSGSLWFDGFIGYMRENEPKAKLERVYFSLGERESGTKNARMASVGSCTEEAAEILRRYSSFVKLEYSRGGHFSDVNERIARGISWILGRD